MEESVKTAFGNVVRSFIDDDLTDAFADLLIVARALGFTETEIEDQFPELLNEPEEDDEEETDLEP